MEEASRGGAVTLRAEDPQGSLKIEGVVEVVEIAVAKRLVLDWVGADKQPCISIRRIKLRLLNSNIQNICANVSLKCLLEH